MKKTNFKSRTFLLRTTKKRLFFSMLLLVVAIILQPQQVFTQEEDLVGIKKVDFERKCATWENHLRLLETDPVYKQNQIWLENFTKNYIEKILPTMAGLRAGIIRIPVVVHVIYNTSTENISDAQIQSQIDVLNTDYRRLNTDISTVPTAFQSLTADTRIEFQLAVRDPNCNATNGITRTSTTKASFPTDDSMKYASSGGHDAWPRDKYLNIWICNLGIMGYAQFPGGAAATDGVVIDYEYFGTNGTVSSPYDLGRTASHEIGHWFNLRHIWGDDYPSADQCAGSDGVADTPNQESMNYGCPTFPNVSCSNGPNGDMFMNYMDYVDDACMVMFTAGQAARMDACIYGTRSAIVASDGLIPPPSTTGVDLWSQDTPEDIGDEPNTASPAMWRSDDIWVRNQNDGIGNQEHQNPEYRPPGFGSSYIYVRVRNKACTGSGSGDVKLYWAKASTALSWPAPWDGSVTTPALMGGLIGTKSTGTVAAGNFVVLEFSWNPPDPADYSSFGADKPHFCLLSRIETSSTSPYGMTFAEGSNLGTNVRNNNNIVWKNITIVDEVAEGGRLAWVTVGNISTSAAKAKFVFAVPKEKGEESIFTWGKVTVDLGAKLFKKWQDGNESGEGVNAIDNRQIQVLKSGAWFGNMKFDPHEFHTIKVRFEPFEQVLKVPTVYKLELIQYETDIDTEELVGGQTFVLKSKGEEVGLEAVKPNCKLYIYIIIILIILFIIIIVVVLRRCRK